MGKISKMFSRVACMDESHWVTPHWHEVNGPEIIRRINDEGGMERKTNEAQPEKP